MTESDIIEGKEMTREEKRKFSFFLLISKGEKHRETDKKRKKKPRRRIHEGLSTHVFKHITAMVMMRTKRAPIATAIPIPKAFEFSIWD